MTDVSERRVCRRHWPYRVRRYGRDRHLAARVLKLLKLYPTFGYRRLWAQLWAEGCGSTRKAVYRVLKLKGHIDCGKRGPVSSH